jgi:hypothetical protein
VVARVILVCETMGWFDSVDWWWIDVAVAENTYLPWSTEISLANHASCNTSSHWGVVEVLRDWLRTWYNCARGKATPYRFSFTKTSIDVCTHSHFRSTNSSYKAKTSNICASNW